MFLSVRSTSSRARPYTGLMQKRRDEDMEMQDARFEAQEPVREECELCGSEMFGLHCKLICPNCGYRRDCSDP